MTLQKSELGKYRVEDTWPLWIDGELMETYVEYIIVRHPDKWGEYRVDHYEPEFGRVKSDTLTADDIRPVIEDLEKVSWD